MDVNDLGQLLLWPKLRVLIKGSARGQCTVHSAQCTGKWWRCCKISKEPTAVFFLLSSGLTCDLVFSSKMAFWSGQGWVGVVVGDMWKWQQSSFAEVANLFALQMQFIDFQIFRSSLTCSYKCLDLDLYSLYWVNKISLYYICDIDKVLISWYFQGLLRHHAGDATARQPQLAQHLAL